MSAVTRIEVVMPKQQMRWPFLAGLGIGAIVTFCIFVTAAVQIDKDRIAAGKFMVNGILYRIERAE